MNPIDIIDKYYTSGSELYKILVTHSQQVTEKSLSIVDAHPELLADRAFIAEAAMLHDIGIIQCYAPRIQCFGTHQYIEHGYLGAAMLRKEGFERHALVAERHTGTGIEEEQIIREKLPIPLGNYSPQSIEEQIICYADKFYSKTRIGEETAVERIRFGLTRFGSASVAKFDRWHALFS